MSYLKNVIVNDSLGLAAQLEDEMQDLVNKFHCEWREVVESPALRKRFAHFINQPREKDPNAGFEPMREQVKAKGW
jgi:nitrite reductase (NADH) large subunit